MAAPVLAGRSQTVLGRNGLLCFGLKPTQMTLPRFIRVARSSNFSTRKNDAQCWLHVCRKSREAKCQTPVQFGSGASIARVSQNQAISTVYMQESPMSDYKPIEGHGCVFQQHRRSGANTPDWIGNLMLQGRQYQVAGWSKQGRNGLLIGLSLRPIATGSLRRDRRERLGLVSSVSDAEPF